MKQAAPVRVMTDFWFFDLSDIYQHLWYTVVFCMCLKTVFPEKIQPGIPYMGPLCGFSFNIQHNHGGGHSFFRVLFFFCDRFLGCFKKFFQKCFSGTCTFPPCIFCTVHSCLGCKFPVSAAAQTICQYKKFSSVCIQYFQAVLIIRPCTVKTDAGICYSVSFF